MGLEKDIQNEPVSSLPLRRLITVPPGMKVREAIAQMRAQGLGCVVVVDDEGKPLGKFTERILINMLLHDPDALDRAVGEHMSGVHDTVPVDAPIARVVDTLESHDLRFIVVTDADGKATALTGQRGVSEYIADHFPRIVATARVGAKPYTKNREGA